MATEQPFRDDDHWGPIPAIPSTSSGHHILHPSSTPSPSPSFIGSLPTTTREASTGFPPPMLPTSHDYASTFAPLATKRRSSGVWAALGRIGSRRRIFYLLIVLAFFAPLLFLRGSTSETLQRYYSHYHEDDPTLSGLSVQDAAMEVDGKNPQMEWEGVSHGAGQTQDTIGSSSPIGNTAVFSLIMYGNDSAREGAVLIKSALMYTSVPLAFHLVVDAPAEEFLRGRLELLRRPPYAVQVVFYRLTPSAMKARLNREGAIITDHSAGSPGLMKLFLHEILPDSVTHSIFIDTDAFFMTDPARLWQTFSDPIAFPPGTGVAIPHHLDLFAPEWHDANRVCSCVLLLDLEVLRGGHGRPALMDSVHYRDAGLEAWGPPAFAKMFGKPAEGHAYEGVKLGDQGYWWALVNGTEGLMTPLDLAWETTSCLVDMYGNDIIVGNDGIDEAEALKQSHYTGHGGVFGSGPAVYPKLLHFNCLDGAPVYWEWAGWKNESMVEWQKLPKRWLPTVQHHVGYKWVWLNQGRTGGKEVEPHGGGPRVTIAEVNDVVFRDERFAKEHDLPTKGTKGTRG